MADFTEGISDAAAARRLAAALDGRGAFRRFKNQLYEHLPELISPWHALRDVRAQRRAVDWFLDQGLIDENAAEKFVARAPAGRSAVDGDVHGGASVARAAKRMFERVAFGLPRNQIERALRSHETEKIEVSTANESHRVLPDRRTLRVAAG